jgi:hypothetical protein
MFLLFLGTLGKFAIHVAAHAVALVEENGVEIGPRYNNEVAFFQDDIGIKIGGEVTARCVTLDTADEHQCFPRLLSVDSIDMQFVFGVGQMDVMQALMAAGGQRRPGCNEQEDRDQKTAGEAQKLHRLHRNSGRKLRMPITSIHFR